MNACLCERPAPAQIPASMASAAIQRIEVAILRDYPEWGWLYGNLTRPPTPEEEARYENQRRQEAADRATLEKVVRADIQAAVGLELTETGDGEYAYVRPEPPKEGEPQPDKLDRILELHDAQDEREARADATSVIPAAKKETEAIEKVQADTAAPRKPKRRAS
jgi:hypothetical protein